MELNLTTFVLELINFLVLVWILKRFLYRPVLDIISRRQESIKQRMAEAQQVHAEADQLKEQYTNRVSDWEKERQAARERLYTELDDERAKRMKELDVKLKEEQDKAHAAAARRLEDATQKIEQTALDQAAAFSARLLSELAGPELESRLLDLVIDDFKTMPEEKRDPLRTGWKQTREPIAVSSVWALPDDARQRLQQVLHEAVDPDAEIDYKQDPELIAGLRIAIGAWVMGANLRDELHAFAEQGHGG